MIWKIYAREPGTSKKSEDYAAECYRAGVIAVGWSSIGDLNKIASFRELKRKLAKKPRKRGAATIAQWAGSLWRFRNDVKRGHLVLCPDRDSRLYYIGEVLSNRAFYDKLPLGGRCKFPHRRKVKWLGVLKRDQIKKSWLAGRQTVIRIRTGDDRLKELIRLPSRPFVGRPRLPSRPDVEWGDAAETRAMEWLKGRGYAPQDVAHLNRGWDITSGEDKFEVKGRKSSHSAVLLTQNEWKAARKFKAGYTVLIFTAPTLDKLKKSTPVQIPDPTRTQSWERRVSYEYRLAE